MIQLEVIAGLYKREKALNAYYPIRVLVINDAEGLLCMNSGEYDLLPGRVFFIPEEGLIRLEGTIESAYWLSFTSFLFSDFLQQHPDPQAKNLFVSLSYRDLDKGELEKMANLLDQLTKEIRLKKDISYLSQYILLFLGYTSALDVMLRVPSPDEMQLLLRFRAILEQYFKTERTTAFYTEGMGMSAKKLNAFLEGVVGKDLLTIIRDRLVREAEELLMHSDLSIAEISNSFGYGRVSAFNSTYKKYKGISVADFLKQSRS